MSTHASVTTPEGVAQFRMVALAHALTLEINTGMKATRHSLVPIAKQYGFTGARKNGALKFIVAKMTEEFGYEPTEQVKKALAK